MPKTNVKSKPKKVKRQISAGQVHIQATFNNTIITVTDDQGRVLAWSSSGAVGFKGSRKSTPYAAQVAAEKVIGIVKDMGLVKVDVLVRGIGSGRESAIRAFQGAGILVGSIKDVTGIPHNGCRPRKARRI